MVLVDFSNLKYKLYNHNAFSDNISTGKSLPRKRDIDSENSTLSLITK